MRNPILVFFLVVITIQPALSQIKQTTSLQQVWSGYFNQTRFSNKWGLWTDLHLRTQEDFFNHFSTGIVRLGLTWYLNDATKFTAGYAHVNFFPADNHKNISQPEHRPWQQVQWHTKYTKTRMMQWIRLEERYRRKILNDSTLAVGYSFNWKLRYNFFFQVPLSRKGPLPKTWSFITND
ncbi:MAG: hypothetical protein JWM28_1756, partial [Chitinophagaceae bacterium]|nr:hypothetical protein [Chitinophagaceae bacterium]